MNQDVDLRAVLTPRQLHVLALVARGLTNPQIAEQLTISPATVENHISAILARLAVQNRTEAAVLAVRSGLLEDVLKNG